MIKASEDNGYTNMEFYRNATTDDDEELDVQHTVRFKSCSFKPPKKKEKKNMGCSTCRPFKLFEAA